MPIQPTDNYTAAACASASRSERLSKSECNEGNEGAIVPPDDEGSTESFRGLILQVRGRTGLTQRELAARVGVAVGSIQGWESGANYPGVASLKALIVASLQGGGFTIGRERAEAQTVWAAALRDAPRFRTPFDNAWFEQITVGRHELGQDEATGTVTALPAPPTTISRAQRESWSEAPDVDGFVGRGGERALLNRWLLGERARVIAVLGLDLVAAARPRQLSLDMLTS